MPTYAQPTVPLPVGGRVRITRVEPPPAVIIGRLTQVDTASLTVINGAGSIVIVPRAEIARIEHSEGHRTAGAAFLRGAGRGALIGAGATVVLLGVAYVADRRRPCHDCWATAPVAAAAVSVPLTTLSALVGGFVGLRFQERWTLLPSP